MGSQPLHLFVFILCCSYLFISSSNAIPMSRVPDFPQKGRDFEVETKNMDKGEIILSDELIEGRMDFEKNDYGPTRPNPVHTPTPPRT